MQQPVARIVDVRRLGREAVELEDLEAAAFAQRVRGAMERILRSRPWTDPQRKWLQRIGEQIEKELVIDREALDQAPFDKDGGFNRLNRVFGGDLEAILTDINEELWKRAS